MKEKRQVLPLRNGTSLLIRQKDWNVINKYGMQEEIAKSILTDYMYLNAASLTYDVVDLVVARAMWDWDLLDYYDVEELLNQSNNND